jgi:hypothetical protein
MAVLVRNTTAGRMEIVVDGNKTTTAVFLSLNPFIARDDMSTVFRYELQLAQRAGVNLLELCLVQTISSADITLLSVQVRAAGYNGYIIFRIALYGAEETEPTMLQGSANGAPMLVCTPEMCPEFPYTLSPEWIASKVGALRTLLPTLAAAFPGQMIGVRPAYLSTGEFFYLMTRFNATSEDWFYPDYSADANNSFCAWDGLPASLHAQCSGAPSVRARWNPTTGNTFVGGESDDDEGTRAVFYERFLASRVASAMEALAKEIKAISGNSLLTMFFYGYLLELGWDKGSGHEAMAQLLAVPSVDILSGPYSYGQ